MRRREFLRSSIAARSRRRGDRVTPGARPTRRLIIAAAGPLMLTHLLRAEPTKRHRIAYLATVSPAAVDPLLEAFRQGLRELGYSDEDVEMEIRTADGQVERLPDLAAELVRLAPEVIVIASPQAGYAAKRATSI